MRVRVEGPLVSHMTVGDIITFNEMCAAEGQMLQRGMYFRLRGRHSVLLMSTRRGAPYRDKWEEGGKILVYEGHDAPKRDAINPKLVDQPATTPKGGGRTNARSFDSRSPRKLGSRSLRMTFLDKVRHNEL